jgi:hypothetical protein
MKKLTTILLLIFLGLTVFLIAVHLKKIEYFIDSKTGETYIPLYENNFKLSAYFNNHTDSTLNLTLSFHNVKTKFNLSSLNVQLDNLELIEIKPYNGMKPWDIEAYSNFASIPDSLKYISELSNPYFAFDNIFKFDSTQEKFRLRISLQFIENAIATNMTKTIEIVKIDKIKLRPFDLHNDITYLLIPVFGLISFVLIILNLIYRLRKNKNNA